jgi:integrase
MSGTVERYGRGWRYRAQVGVDPATGRRRWATKGGFATQKAARTALHTVLSDADDGLVVKRSRLTLGEYLDEWLAGARVDLKPTTIAAYGRAIDKLKLQLGRVRLQDLTTLAVERAYHDLTKQGLAPKTVRNTHMVLRRALADAERLGLIVRNPAASARPPASVHTEQSTWTAAELNTFLVSVSNHRLFASFVLSATTGLRRGELLGLRWRDLDLAAGRLKVRHTITTVDGRPIESTTKTNKSRRLVALDAVTVAVLERHAEDQEAERLSAGSAWRETGLVFTEADGAALNPDLYSKLFTRLVGQANVPSIRLHDLRHTHATLALEAGVHPKIVSDRLGHATVGITLDLYSHVSPSLDEAAAETIAALLDVPGHSPSVVAGAR